MVDLALSDEEKEIRSWVRTFVTKELLPLEPDALARERRGERGLAVDDLLRLQDLAKQAGFFGIQTPEAYGGMGLSAVMTALVMVNTITTRQRDWSRYRPSTITSRIWRPASPAGPFPFQS